MQNWWLNRQPRERLLLGGGGLVLALVVLYVLVWEPWQQHLERLRTEVSTLQTDLAWIQEAATRLQQLQATATVAGSGAGSTPPGSSMTGMALATRVEQSARSAGLDSTLRRLEPQADDSLRLWLEQISFADLLPWLAGLQNAIGIRISEAQIERPATPRGDRVNVRLTLRGA